MTFAETLDRHLRAIAQRDATEFAATLSVDPAPHVIGPDGSIIAGHDAVLAAHRDWFSSMEFTFDPNIIWQRESGDLGIALVRVRYAEPEKEPREFYLLLAFARNDDRWGMFYDQNTPIGAA